MARDRLIVSLTNYLAISNNHCAHRHFTLNGSLLSQFKRSFHKMIICGQGSIHVLSTGL
jgi:hypothetical protein